MRLFNVFFIIINFQFILLKCNNNIVNNITKDDLYFIDHVLLNNFESSIINYFNKSRDSSYYEFISLINSEKYDPIFDTILMKFYTNCDNSVTKKILTQDSKHHYSYNIFVHGAYWNYLLENKDRNDFLKSYIEMVTNNPDLGSPYLNAYLVNNIEKVDLEDIVNRQVIAVHYYSVLSMFYYKAP